MCVLSYTPLCIARILLRSSSNRTEMPKEKMCRGNSRTWSACKFGCVGIFFGTDCCSSLGSTSATSLSADTGTSSRSAELSNAIFSSFCFFDAADLLFFVLPRAAAGVDTERGFFGIVRGSYEVSNGTPPTNRFPVHRINKNGVNSLEGCNSTQFVRKEPRFVYYTRHCTVWVVHSIAPPSLT